jgi:hypothetical protein
MGAELTTYLLHGLTAFDVAEIRSMEPPYFEVGRFGYGVLVAGFAPTNQDRVGRVLPGDNRDVIGGWLQQRGVDRFVSEYEKTRPPVEEGQRALEAWREIAEKRIVLEHEGAELLSRRRKVMDALKEARQSEVDASADVVRKTGKTLLKVGDEVWELREYRSGLKFYRTRG